ncbi:MAG TPA: hypothetical protein VNN76_00070 [Bacteroidota bacterium]|nr:hypothetical protein [Bacteroidota bacterium]
MDRYLIVVPHTAQECTKALKQIEAIGSITRFDFGCKDGEHCGWVVIEAESKKEALLVVPPLERSNARVIKLVRFTPEDIRAAH